MDGLIVFLENISLVLFDSRIMMLLFFKVSVDIICFKCIVSGASRSQSAQTGYQLTLV